MGTLYLFFLIPLFTIYSNYGDLHRLIMRPSIILTSNVITLRFRKSPSSWTWGFYHFKGWKAPSTSKFLFYLCGIIFVAINGSQECSFFLFIWTLGIKHRLGKMYRLYWTRANSVSASQIEQSSSTWFIVRCWFIMKPAKHKNVLNKFLLFSLKGGVGFKFSLLPLSFLCLSYSNYHISNLFNIWYNFKHVLLCIFFTFFHLSIYILLPQTIFTLTHQFQGDFLWTEH